MAAAPQFDLFAGAKGYEYARDRNTQDEDNALKTRQNQMSLDAFERQLREYDKGAELRTLTRENQTATAKGQGAKLKQQNEYFDTMNAARASLTPEQLGDTSALGNLNRMHAMQQYMQTNKSSPAVIEAFGKEIGNTKAAALAYAQSDPDALNQVLLHPAMGGGEYRVNPVEGTKGQYQILKQAPPDESGMRPYYPVPNLQGNLGTVAYTLASQFPNSGGPDRGAKMGFAFDTIERNREMQADAQQTKRYGVELAHSYNILKDGTQNKRYGMQAQNSAAAIAAREAAARLRYNGGKLEGMRKTRASLAAARNKNAPTQPVAITQQQDAEIARMDAAMAMLDAENNGHHEVLQQSTAAMFGQQPQPQYTPDQQIARENAGFNYTPNLFNPYAVEADELKNNPQLDTNPDGSYDNG